MHHSFHRYHTSKCHHHSWPCVDVDAHLEKSVGFARLRDHLFSVNECGCSRLVCWYYIILRNLAWLRNNHFPVTECDFDRSRLVSWHHKYHSESILLLGHKNNFHHNPYNLPLCVVVFGISLITVGTSASFLLNVTDILKGQTH